MASLDKIPYTKGEARERLRPSEISKKIVERGWMNEIQIKLAIQEGYACTPEQADVILEIAVQNGFVESVLRGGKNWWYRIVEPASAGEEVRKTAGYTRRGSNVAVGVDAETAIELDDPF